MIALFLVLALQAGTAQSDVIRGLDVEDRSNHVHGCSCEWSGESQTGGREAILAWRFLEGGHAGVPLAGAGAAVVLRGEATFSMGFSTRQGVLFIDAATPAQRRAVEALLREKYERFFGHILRVSPAGIRMEVNARGARVHIPGTLALEVRKAVLPDDAVPGATRWDDPFVPLQQAELGTRVFSRCSAPDFHYVWSEQEPATSGYYGRFVFYSR